MATPATEVREPAAEADRLCEVLASHSASPGARFQALAAAIMSAIEETGRIREIYVTALNELSELEREGHTADIPRDEFDRRLQNIVRGVVGVLGGPM